MAIQAKARIQNEKMGWQPIEYLADSTDDVDDDEIRPKQTK